MLCSPEVVVPEEALPEELPEEEDFEPEALVSEVLVPEVLVLELLEEPEDLSFCSVVVFAVAFCAVLFELAVESDPESDFFFVLWADELTEEELSPVSLLVWALSQPARLSRRTAEVSSANRRVREARFLFRFIL